MTGDLRNHLDVHYYNPNCSLINNCYEFIPDMFEKIELPIERINLSHSEIPLYVAYEESFIKLVEMYKVGNSKKVEDFWNKSEQYRFKWLKSVGENDQLQKQIVKYKASDEKLKLLDSNFWLRLKFLFK